MSKRKTFFHWYGLILVYGVSLLLCLFAIAGCKGIQGGAIGGGVGAATGTPQGIGVGAAAGFFVGLWNDITDVVVGWWHNLFGPSVVTEQGPSVRHEIWQWIILLAVVIAILKFVYHYAFDADFRGHVHGFFKPKLPKRKRDATPTA